MASNPIAVYSVEEYLEAERLSDQRHEYISGEIVPVYGGTPWHSVIAVNASSELRHLCPRGCRVFDASLMVCLDRASNYGYPDATVVCGPLEFTGARNETVTNPKVVVEVLSPTTQDYDLGQKLRLYWKLPTLTDVLLIAQDRVWIEHWFRGPDGGWNHELIENPDGVVRIESLNCEIPAASLYAGVEFPA